MRIVRQQASIFDKLSWRSARMFQLIRFRLPSNRLQKSRRCRRGFTLVEILVVLAIIGLIMGLVGPQVMRVLGDSREKTAKMQIQNLASALEVFYLDTGRYPSVDEGLNVLVTRPAETDVWNGPYLRGGGVPKDPWGNAFSYHVPGKNGEPFEIMSLGPSGRSVNRTDTAAGRE